MQLQILVNTQNGDQKAGSFESNTNLVNLDMGHSNEIYSLGIYLNSQIFGTVQLQILVNTQNGDQKAGSFESNTNLVNLDMGHSNEIYSLGIYLNSQIFGASQYAKFGEKTAMIRCRFEAKIFFVSM